MQVRASRTAIPRKALRTGAAFVLLLAVAVAAWEGYKAMGRVTGGFVPFTSWRLPVSPHNTAMPHTWDIVFSLVSPAQRGSSDTLFGVLSKAALFTFREAITGFVIGSAVGFSLALLFESSRPVERGLMPYVIASQTVPLLAIAPMVVIWGGKAGLPTWVAVSVIAAYLSFFPVTINTLRGLRSPPSSAIELMRSYAASRGQILRKLQIPAAVPYVFTALRIAATASVIGALVGELPASLSEGLGRSLLTFSYYFQSGSERLFAALAMAALLGLATVGLVILMERFVVPRDRRVEG